MQSRAAGRADLYSDRSGPCDDYRQVRRYRQGQGADPARTAGARAVLPQRLRGHAAGRREFLRPAVRHRIHVAAEAGSGQFSQYAVTLPAGGPEGWVERAKPIAGGVSAAVEAAQDGRVSITLNR